MRIAIVTESFLPHVNGVTNTVLRVLDHLEARGDEALVVAPDEGPTRYGSAEVVRVPALQLPVIDSLPVAAPSGRGTRALVEFAPDVVHLASPAFLGWRAAYAARRLGLPAVAVYQTDLVGFASAYRLGFLRGPARRGIRTIHGMAARTLAPSTATARDLRGYGVPRVQLWRRGVDTDAFAPRHRSDSLRRELAPGGELLVGYVGRLAAEKSVHRLAALHGMPGVRVVVVGDGPDRPALQRALPDAAFLGQLTGTELARAYASLDVFVHTGAYETFCQTVQEALASGVPVIVPDAGGPRDLVSGGDTGFLVPARRDEEFAAGMVSAVGALADGQLRAEFAARARASVRGRTWSAVCDELVGHYRAVAGVRQADAEGVAA